MFVDAPMCNVMKPLNVHSELEAKLRSEINERIFEPTFPRCRASRETSALQKGMPK